MEKMEKGQKPWGEYYAITEKKPPSKLLVEALEYTNERNSALDLGAGALKDSKFLLTQGFKKVTIVDAQPAVEEFTKKLPQKRVKVYISPFNKFPFPVKAYDIVNAQFCLPFNPKDSLDEVIVKIKGSIKIGGIFTGQLFGINDEWNLPATKLSFHTEEQVRKLFADMEIISFLETDEDSKTATGVGKHWNYFDIIAKKI